MTKESIIVCSNSGCLSSGGVDVFITLFTEIFSNPQLNEKYEVKRVVVMGLQVDLQSLLETRIFILR